MVSVVTLLVICSRNLEEGSDSSVKVSRTRGAETPPPRNDLLLLPPEDTLLLRQSRTISTVRARTSRFSRGIWRRVQAMEADLLTQRRKLHRLPELANREVRTSNLIASALKAVGVEVRMGIAGTGVVGLIKGGRSGPVVAVRAVMDGVAVPERSGLEFASTEKARFMGRSVPVSHAAGHDIEMAVLLGTAEILADLRQELPGTIKLIFQPASEGLPPGERGGARAMIADGVLAAPSVGALFALKVQPKLLVTQIAIDTSTGGGGVARFEILLASPSQGACRRPGPRCPDLISAAAQLVLNLRNIPTTRMDAAGRLLITVGSIHAGRTGELLPAKLQIKGSIRWRQLMDRNLAMHLIRRATAASAAVAGARANVKFEHGGVLIGNNPRLARWSLGTAVRVLRRSGIRISSVPPVTDSGFDLFRRRVPSVLVQLGVTPRGSKPTAVRTPEFVADERAVAVGVNLLANLLVDYLLEASGDLRSLGRQPRDRRPAAVTPRPPRDSADSSREVSPRAAPARPTPPASPAPERPASAPPGTMSVTPSMARARPPMSTP